MARLAYTSSSGRTQYFNLNNSNFYCVFAMDLQRARAVKRHSCTRLAVLLRLLDECNAIVNAKPTVYELTQKYQRGHNCYPCYATATLQELQDDCRYDYVEVSRDGNRVECGCFPDLDGFVDMFEVWYVNG